MGKFRVKKQTTNISLVEQMIEDKTVRTQARQKHRKAIEHEETSEFVESRLSKKILEQARLQQAELEESQATGSKSTAKISSIHFAQEDNSDEELQEPAEDFNQENVQVSADDEQQMALFMSADPSSRKTLADYIQEKLTEKRTEIQTHMSDGTQIADMDERVVNMYKKVGEVLRKYRSGRIPKAFKVVPTLSNWEQILYIMEPDTWSAASVYQATRLFTSGLSAKMAQRFFNLILLPRIRDDIMEYKKLNFHLYMAVKKALYKPGAFFKGFLLPLCESGTCTLQEAVIIASILQRDSIPMLHSAAAILKLAEMNYNGACSVFLRTLLDKKYALPYRVVDAVVYHFIGFQNDKRNLPVLWHQCLLVFVQRYKEDISSEQKESLQQLLKKHIHEGITPEIRREIMNSKCRDEEMLEPPNAAEMME